MRTKGYVERAIINGLPDGPTEDLRSAIDTKSIHQQYVRSTEESAEASTTRRALNRLADKGLVEKHTPERYGDRTPRQNHWRLTDGGHEEKKELDARYREESDAVRKRFGRNPRNS